MFDEWIDEESVNGFKSDGFDEGIGRADCKTEQRRPERQKTKSSGKDLKMEYLVEREMRREDDEGLDLDGTMD